MTATKRSVMTEVATANGASVTFTKLDPSTYVAEWSTGSAVIHRNRGCWNINHAGARVCTENSLKSAKAFIARRLAHATPVS